MTEQYTKPPTKQERVWMIHPDNMVYGDPSIMELTSVPVFFYEFSNDPNVLVINAGSHRGCTGKIITTVPTEPLRELIAAKVTPETRLCFDNLYEGNLVPVIHKIYDLIQGTHIKPSQCNYFSAGLDSNKLHDEYCERNNITDKINIYSCNTWERGLLTGSEVRRVDYVIKNKQKTFLCFNRILRSHRVALLGLLYNKNLVKDAFYSFFPDSSHSGEPTPIGVMFYQIANAVSSRVYAMAKSGYQSNAKNLPLQLNIDWRENVNYIKVSDLELFQESYFSLVTETYFFGQPIWTPEKDEDTIFFTEKIYKPILMKHPFILASRPHSLKYLRKLGYKTFAPHINEIYDDLEDNGERLSAIVTEVERLNKFTPEQWIEWQNNIKEIVEHNHSIIINRKKHHYAFTRPDYETQY